MNHATDFDDLAQPQVGEEKELIEIIPKKTRTLSDSVTYVKPQYNSDPIEEDILKLDSNYSEAIEEVV